MADQVHPLGAGGVDERADAARIEQDAHAVLGHVQRRLARAALRLPRLRPIGRALLAIQHVGPRDLVLARAHQRELDLVLDVLDV